MKIKEIIDHTPIGGVVTDKRLLAVLKRKGLIYGYSQWGYLENPQLCYKESDGYSDWKIQYLFPKGNAPKEYCVDCGTYDELRETYGGGNIEYMGCIFSTKYLDGCFNAYLQLVEKNGKREQETKPTMSLWGRIV